MRGNSHRNHQHLQTHLPLRPNNQRNRRKTTPTTLPNKTTSKTILLFNACSKNHISLTPHSPLPTPLARTAIKPPISVSSNSAPRRPSSHKRICRNINEWGFKRKRRTKRQRGGGRPKRMELCLKGSEKRELMEEEVASEAVVAKEKGESAIRVWEDLVVAL